jgi:heme/copper-type cytochrome/quinol oxidase subunit 1
MLIANRIEARSDGGLISFSSYTLAGWPMSTVKMQGNRRGVNYKPQLCFRSKAAVCSLISMILAVKKINTNLKDLLRVIP